jgi:DNA-binding beta-propeller fold protein YncE
MGHPFITPDPTCTYTYVSIGSPEIRSSEYMAAAGVAKLNMDDGSLVNIMGTGNHPIGITHSADGLFTYVVDGHGSEVYKIDNEKNEVIGRTSAGVAGPYGIAMNWDESMIFTVGKGEGTHNRGAVLGVIDGKLFSAFRGLEQMPIWLGGSASSVDHAILHPDPEVNELWVSNMNGWDTIVLDLETLSPTDHILTPNGGDTHSGGFVRYEPDWTGQLMADQGGPVAQSMRDAILAAKEAK